MQNSTKKHIYIFIYSNKSAHEKERKKQRKEISYST